MNGFDHNHFVDVDDDGNDVPCPICGSDSIDPEDDQ